MLDTLDHLSRMPVVGVIGVFVVWGGSAVLWDLGAAWLSRRQKPARRIVR